MNLTLIFLSAIVLFLLYGALRWEANDIKKLYARRNVYEIKNRKEREKEYKFYATFNHENHIMWRSLFISSFIASVIIYIYFKNFSNSKNLELDSFVVLFTIFLVFYLTHLYRNFHIYRVMASKVRKDYSVMENIS